ncbi:hypothetical protein [Pseudarthrobacter sp. efr-133-R2A-89]|uniref:hypothetical protein n=1 Tax=Pseudarthrobacter sp. efr-133-R2A-89 TaxID=3040302 RepID=UPI002552FF4A|nr:hypothetical protein [Pseudarthrobacter sp. efr-133-R2A-89]
MFFPELASAPDLFFLLPVQFVALLCVPWRQLNSYFGCEAAVEFPAPLCLGIELGSEKHRNIQNPQPQQHDDYASDGAISLVVIAEVAV